MNRIRAPKIGELIIGAGTPYRVTQHKQVGSELRVYGIHIRTGRETFLDVIGSDGMLTHAGSDFWQYEDGLPTQRSGELSGASKPMLATDKLESAVYDFFTKPKAGHCACNIPRLQCRYHGPED